MGTGYFQRFSNLCRFVKVAEAGSFSKVALELSTTRSLVGRHVIELEKALGICLVLRDGRRFGATRSGEQVSPRAWVMCAAAR